MVSTDQATSGHAASRGRIIRRFAVLLILLSLPVGIVITKVWSEPYPWLLGPKFEQPGTSGDAVQAVEYRVWVTDSAGNRVELNPYSLLEETYEPFTWYPAVFATTFADSEYLEWLKERVQSVGVEHPKQLEFQSCKTYRSRTDGAIVQQSCSESTFVDLGEVLR